MKADRISDYRYLYIASAIGIGNLSALPVLFVEYGPILVLSLNLLFLVLLSVPLFVAEILWARWLCRPLTEAFAFLPKPYRVLPYFIFLALLMVAGENLLQLSQMGALFLGSPDPSALPFSLGGAALVGAVICFVLYLFPKGLEKIFVFLIKVSAFLFFVALIFSVVLGSFSLDSFLLSLPSTMGRIDLELLLATASLCLFSLSSGLGVHYVMTLRTTSIRGGPSRLPLWQKPGEVHRIALMVMGLDFLASLLVFFLFYSLAPETSMGTLLAEGNFHWLFNGGLSHWGLQLPWIFLGMATLLALVESIAHILRYTLLRSRRFVYFNSFFVLCIVLLGLQVEKLRYFLSEWALELMLPLVALGICTAPAYFIPEKTRRVLLGRSANSDSLSKLWAFSGYFLLPLVLIAYFFLSLGAQI